MNFIGSNFSLAINFEQFLAKRVIFVDSHFLNCFLFCLFQGTCIYHIGKLKFYSCKSCGCDEYYNCCGKCSKCSKGCA